MESRHGKDTPAATARTAEAHSEAKPVTETNEDKRTGRNSAAWATTAPLTERELVFECHRNVIYHGMREAWFDRIHRRLMFLVVICSTASVADLASGIPWSQAALGAIAALSGLTDLLFSVGVNARLHGYLRRDFYRLYAKAHETGPLNEAAQRTLSASLLRLYADEPPPMKIVDLIAHNTATTSLGREGELYSVSFWQRILCHMLPFDSVRLKI